MPTPLRAACVLIAVEALALVAAAAILVTDTIVGKPDNVGRALFGAVLALAAAAVLAYAARGLFRLSAAARTPVVVLQVLTVPVSYSLAFQADRPAYGGPILLVALAVLYLLFTPPSRAVLDRDPPG